MNDYFLALFCMGWMFGILTGCIMIGILMIYDYKSSDPDNSPTNRGEEVINGLQALRMSLSRTEKEYLDYACECVEKVEREVNKDDN